MHLSCTSLVVALSLASVSIAAPKSNTHVLHEKRDGQLRAWEKRDRVKADVVLPVRIGLTQRNLEHGHKFLDEVSNPESPKYGDHYTAKEVNELFAPHKTTVDTVREWLHSAGIEPKDISLSANKQWMQFDASASKVEGLLQTEYYNYDHQRTGKSNIGCDEYSVPEHVREHVDYITPGLKLLTPSTPRDAMGKAKLEKRIFGVTKPKGSHGSKAPPVQPPLKRPLPRPLSQILAVKSQADQCDQYIIPSCITTMYNITQPSKAAANNELGIFEDLGDYYAQEDLTSFFQTFTQIPNMTHPILQGIDGATAPTSVGNAGAESDLDLQISYPIIYPQNIRLFQTDDAAYEANYQYEGFLNNFLDALDGSYCSYSAYGETGNSDLDPSYPNPATGGYKGKLQCGVYKPTKVISISYGGQEYDLPASYQRRQCNEFLKLGLQGVSIVISSGDSGVAGPDGDDNNNGCLGASATVFSPDFPATCPYVTTAGATLLTGSAAKDEETAVTRFPSGGGFSNIYPIPAYQRNAVAKYFATAKPSYPYYTLSANMSFGTGGGLYCRNGRGYPDISAVGDNVVIFNQGQAVLIGGTSASAPVFAAILNRINEERIAVGKKTVGFVNPVLYAYPQVLHDITVGTNPGCGTNGFSAAVGWDPLTGLGTPNYPALLNLFMRFR